MTEKPTYEELVKRIQNLEQEILRREQTEMMQQESEAALKSILRAVPIGIGVVCDRVIKEANERLCEILGYSSEEILGNSARMFYLTDEDFEYVGHEKYAQIHEKGIGSVETCLRRKDGNVIDVLLSSAPLDPMDLSIGVTFTVLDVTNRKQSERDLQKSEQKYRLLVESTPDWVWICDKEGLQTFSNKAVKQILGYEVQEILGASAFRLMHPEDRKRIQKWFQNAKNQKRGWKGSVIRWQHKDKSIRFLETIAEPIVDAKDNLTGFTGIDRDVTARKLSEEALRKAHDELEQRVKERTAELVLINENLQQEIVDRQHAETELVKSKAMLKAVVNSLPFDVFALDSNNRYFLQNSICKKNWGDLIGKCPEDLPVNKETINLWMDNNHRALSGETITEEVEYHRLEGRKNFYYNIIAPIRDEEKIFGILGVLVDISELKQAEKDLRDSEKRYRRLVETMNDGIGIQDASGLITYVNNKFSQMLGYKPDEFIGKPVTNFLDDHNSQILKNQTSIRRKGKVKAYEIEWTCKDGRKIQTIMSPQAIFNDNGQFKGSFSVITDISILKQVGDALWESKEQFRNLTEITSDWIWEIDKNGFYTYVSPKVRDMLGYEPEEIIGKTPFDLMPPEEADRVTKIFNNISASQKTFDCLENLNLHKDGHPVVLETSGIPTFSADGEFLGYRGIDRDITRRKRTEEALRKAHDELESRVKERTRELKIEKGNLEEANIAMKVLLRKREEDKKDIGDNVLTNVRKLIDPYLDKIKKTKLDGQQKAFLNIMESNLHEITSQFARKISLRELNLTPTEIQIANMIRNGNSSKEIAGIMNVSVRTVDAHRRNIRKKMGLNQKRANLRSYLLSLH
jgi:PAS domain S-box-containing protein